MIYKIVHLSDMHFRPDWQEENDLVCDQMLKDIQSQCKDLADAYVAFTGDLAFAAEDPRCYSGFLDRFVPRLDAAGLNRSRRIVIPGNHDVDRNALQKNLTLQNGAVSATNTERSFNDYLPELEAQYFAAKFVQYKACEKTFADYQCCGTSLGGTGFNLPGGVGIYCMNTALASSAGMCDQDGKKISDEGKLPVATRILHKWLANDDSKIRVLLSHHPLSWLTAWASAELEKTISSAFHLVLTGHLHTAKDVRRCSNNPA